MNSSINPEKIQSINQHAQGVQDHVSGIASDVSDEASAQWKEARNQISDAVDTVSDYVRDYPLASVGAGIVVGWLISLAFFRRS